MGVIKLIFLRQGDYPGLFKWALDVTRGVLAKEGKRFHSEGVPKSLEPPEGSSPADTLSLDH